MKLVMTLLARDEADVVDAQIAFHLHAGVDFVVATDNRSEDGTTEILERYQRAGRLHLLREPGDDMRQDEWVTRMARLAATDFGADWVLNADADEFWWPRGGSLKDVLALVPERYGLVRGCWRHFLPRAGEEELLRGAHDRPAVRARASGREGDDLPRAPEGRPPRRSRLSRSLPGTTTRTAPAWHRRFAAGIRSRCCTSRSARCRSSGARRFATGGVGFGTRTGRRCTRSSRTRPVATDGSRSTSTRSS